MESNSSSRSDAIIYLTLVDFLVQIIFFGIFLFVAVFASQTQSAPDLTPEQERWGLPILEGFGKLVSAENVPIFIELAKFLKSKQDLVELVDALNRSGSVSELLKGAKVINGAGGSDAASKRLGVGRPACLGEKTPLLTVRAYDDTLLVEEISDAGETEFDRLNIDVRIGAHLTLDQFAMLFKPVSLQKVDGNPCFHFIRYRRSTKYEAPRIAVDKLFLISN